VKANRPDQEDNDDDDFDRLPNVEAPHVRKDSDMEDADVSRANGSTTYYAKDEKYDFKRQGHQNRRDQISKLQQSAEYSEWKEANKKEYAVVHAKFYVSIPKIMHYRPPPTAASGGFKAGVRTQNRSLFRNNPLLLISKPQKRPRSAQIIKL
jgi:hypothetical protein